MGLLAAALCWASTAPAVEDAGERAPAEPAASEPAPRDDSRGEERDEPSPERLSGAPKRQEERPLPDNAARPVPDYDGRGDEPTTAGDVLLWIPRVLFSPLYFVSEFIVRRPLGALTTWAEREEVPTLLLDFFTFGPDRYAGVLPTAFVDFGFRPSIGLYFFHNRFFAENNKLRAKASYGGSDWLNFVLADRVELDRHQDLSVRAEYLRRPDWVFGGLGPSSSDDDLARYLRRDLTTALRYRAQTWRSSSIDTEVSLTDVDYDIGRGCCDHPSVQSLVDDGRLEEPVGHGDGFFVLSTSVSASLDSRKRRNLDDPVEGSDFVSPPGDGVRLQLRGEHHGGLDQRVVVPGAAPTRYEWMTYGATLGGFVDITGEQRVVGLSLITDFADPLGEGGEIPFDRNVALGGPRPMRGFLEGRLRGRSAAVALLEYRWPVWVWLDGSLHYAVGNTFGPQLEGFEFEKLRNSFGLGIQGTGSRDHVFQILLAFGTRPFEDGAGVESIRLALGATSGF